MGPPPQTRRLALPHYLALLAAPIAFLQIWTIVSWLKAGPFTTTSSRTPGSTTWYAAHACEIAIAIVSIAVIVHLYRDCKSRGKFLTFDVIFCIGCATIWWADAALNFFAPTFLTSSNFVNLNSPLGQLPFKINPGIGQGNDPVLFFFLVETFGVLGAALLVGKQLSRFRAKHPAITRRQEAAIIIGVAVGIELAWEPVSLALGLWTYELPLSLHVGGLGGTYPVAELVAGSLWFAFFIMVREFRNDRGESIVERGLERHSGWARTVLTIAAFYALAQLIMWIPGNLPTAVSSFYEPAWHGIPADLLNGQCSVPGTTEPATAYGPCPGSPGFTLPIRHYPTGAPSSAPGLPH